MITAATQTRIEDPARWLPTVAKVLFPLDVLGAVVVSGLVRSADRLFVVNDVEGRNAARSDW